MSDEDEMEKFEMDDEDMDRMFNPTAFRRNHKQTKEEAMLGIWATGSGRDGRKGQANSSDEDEDDDDFSYNKQKKKASGAKGGVNFVPSTKKLIKPTDFKKPKKYESDEEYEDMSKPAKASDASDDDDEDEYQNKKSYKVS
jgi:hypothetical protein